eukprot:1238309-Rhodomonas_salina.2
MVARRSISHGRLVFGLALCVMLASASAFAPTFLGNTAGVRKLSTSAGMRLRSPPATALRMQETKEKKDPEEVVRKFGLEAGLFTALNLTLGHESANLQKLPLFTEQTSASATLDMWHGGINMMTHSGHRICGAQGSIPNPLPSHGSASLLAPAALRMRYVMADTDMEETGQVALTPLTAQYLFNKKVEDTEDQQ